MLPLEQLAEAALVHREPGAFGDLLGHFEREPVRVGEPERCIRVDPPLALRRGSGDGLVDHRESLRERALELLLFFEDDLCDAVARRGQFVVVALHRLHDLGPQLRQRAGLEP